MAIYNTQITATTAGSADTLASGSGARAITTVIVCNTGATDLNLTLYAVPSSGSAGVASPLPATPTTYFKIKVNGTEYVVPAYAVA